VVTGRRVSGARLSFFQDLPIHPLSIQPDKFRRFYGVFTAKQLARILQSISFGIWAI
jgi:hypothetical protein